MSFHLAPPGLSRPGPGGRPKKIRFGAWVLPAFGIMAKARHWRGSWLDPWKNSQENKLDRQLLAGYESDLDFIVGHSPNPELVALANWPAEVRGFGPVRSEAAAKVAGRREALRQLA